MKTIKRETSFIESDTGMLYASRPNNWISGWLRYLWFKKKTGKEVHIVSPDFWDLMAGRYKVKTLIEYSDGQYEIIDCS
jgi:hypothetical protein